MERGNLDTFSELLQAELRVEYLYKRPFVIESQFLQHLSGNRIVLKLQPWITLVRLNQLD